MKYSITYTDNQDLVHTATAYASGIDAHTDITMRNGELGLSNAGETRARVMGWKS